MMSALGTAVGANVPRLDGRDKVTGAARYIDDLSRPGMLYACLVTSPHAHARIKSYDLSAARALPGVKAVLTGSDFERRRVGGFIKDETVLACDKVRYIGEPVAAIAARDLRTARYAAQLVAVEYELLPAVLTIDAALAVGAPHVHEELDAYVKTKPGNSGGNVVWRSEIREGDIDRAWASCDVVVEQVYETQAQHHAYMEPNGVLAEIEPGGRVAIWSSCQSVHHVQQRVAEELGLPMSQVRALVPRVGGAFGGKHASNIHSITAALALATGKPVKLALSRTEDFEVQRSRHPARIRMKTGARRDGMIVAREAEVILDGGAYTDESPAVLAFALLMARGPYRIPNVRLHGKVAYTNKLRAGSFRGFGNPQASFAGESQIDELAAALAMDPVELRLRNAMRDGDTMVGGQRAESCKVALCLEQVRSARNAAPAMPAPRPGRRRGVGYAAFAHVCGLMSTSASVHLRTDGSIALSTGTVDIGQGSDTVLTQICAGVLGVPVESISYGAPDSDTSPYNWKTAASRSTYMTGRAVVGAAEAAREQILKHASEIIECAPADLELRPGGRVGLKGVPGKEVSFKEVAQRSLYVSGGPIIGTRGVMFDGERFDPKRAAVDRIAFDNLGVYIFGAQAVEVEVDEATGKVEVLRAWSAHDVGRAINPRSVEGQIQGAFVQGLGYALTEEMIWDDDGRLANPSLAEYAVPGVLDVPCDIVPIVLEDPEPTGPFGAKGIGEPALVGAAPAIANAIANATERRIRRLPMTPERVLDAIDEESQP